MFKQFRCRICGDIKKPEDTMKDGRHKPCQDKRRRIYFRNKSMEELKKERKEKHLAVLNSGKKICSKCGKEKFLTEFRKESKGQRRPCLGGYYSKCRECERELNSERRPRKPPKILLSKEEKEGRKEEQRQRNIQNSRERYWNDAEYREIRLQYSRKRYYENRAYMIAKKHRREALMIKKDDGTVSQKVIDNLLRQTVKCIYCGNRIDYPELDHMDPLSRGGDHSIRNIIIVCRKCNQFKKSKPFNEWLKYIPEERREIVSKAYERRHRRIPEQGFLSLQIRI